MTAAVNLYPAISTTVLRPGQAVVVAYGPILGGVIANPYSSDDQGIALSEVLYVDISGAPASLGTTSTSVAIQPGQTFDIPNETTTVSVNAVSAGHKFTAILFQPPTSVTPGQIIGATNPTLQDIIGSYLYQQYSNDDDLQAFVTAYNELAQEYLDWLNDLTIPVYTNPLITGDLLDWIAEGLYGVRRPVLSAGNNKVLGPYNTYQFNTLAYNTKKTLPPPVFQPVSDDIFKRVLTWKLYKGDGKNISIEWLKKRVLRFLLGVNGTDVNTADTSQISVTFGFGTGVTLTVIKDTFVPVPNGAIYNTFRFNTTAYNGHIRKLRLIQTAKQYTHGNQININLLSRFPTSVGGALYNKNQFNSIAYNAFSATFRQVAPLPNTLVLKEAIEQGVLDMPFQFTTVVNIR